jgi:hypothetical protein
MLDYSKLKKKKYINRIMSIDIRLFFTDLWDSKTQDQEGEQHVLLDDEHTKS